MKARANKILWVVYVVVVTTALGVFHSIWQDRMKAMLASASVHAQGLSGSLATVLKTAGDHVRLIQGEAEGGWRNIDRFKTPASLLGNLVPDTASHSYYTAAPIAGVPANEQGMVLVGAPLPPANGARHREIALAVALDPIFKVARNNLPDVTWIYYYSAARIINMYPYENTGFRWNDELLDHEIYVGASPAENPSGDVYWSKAYPDEAGKGLMSSITAPVRDPAGKFRAIVGLDIPLNTLSSLMRKSSPSLGDMLLVNKHGQVLAKSSPRIGDDGSIGGKALPSDLLSATEYGRYLDIDDRTFFITDVRAAPWRLILAIDRSELRLAAARDLKMLGAVMMLVVMMLVLLETMNRDAAEKRALRDALVVEKDAAQAASRAKSRFLATMSHEIRTPMNGILGMARLLRLSAHAPDQREQADILLHSGEALQRILCDVLDLSKLEAGKLTICREVFNPHRLARQVVDLYRPVAEGKGLSLSCSFGEELPHAVNGDPFRIRQILSNLVSNAIKFTDAGQVHIRVDNPRPQALRFDVSDTGIGIRADLVDRLFDPFEQGDAGSTARSGGTGLGLAISRQLTELHGGTIQVVSTPGHGSRFRVELPLDPADPALAKIEPEPQPLPGRALRPLDLLLVEDNDVNRRVMELALAGQGHRVTPAGNGREALERAGRQMFDAILMDMRMPEMDGLEATRRIRALPPPNNAIPIVALTANVFDTDAAACFEAGMNEFMPKPVNIDRLGEVLARLHDRDLPDVGGETDPGAHFDELRRDLLAALDDAAPPDMLAEKARTMAAWAQHCGLTWVESCCRRLEKACCGDGDLRLAMLLARAALNGVRRYALTETATS